MSLNKILLALALMVHIGLVASSAPTPGDAPSDAPNDAPSDPPVDAPEDTTADYCSTDAWCKKNGDAGATCVNGACTCSTGYQILTVNNVKRERDGCYATGTNPATVTVDRFLVIRFGGGVFSRLTPAARAFLTTFLRTLFRFKTSVLRQGSIIVGTHGQTTLAAADKLEPAAVLTKWTDNVKANTAMQAIFGTPARMLVTVSSQGASAVDCLAVTGVSAHLKLGTACVPFTCAKGYSLKTGTTPTCVKSSSSKLSGGAIAGIVIGCLVFVAVAVVAVYFLAVKKTQAPPPRQTAPTHEEHSV